jgi:hypothetical protein
VISLKTFILPTILLLTLRFSSPLTLFERPAQENRHRERERERRGFGTMGKLLYDDVAVNFNKISLFYLSLHAKIVLALSEDYVTRFQALLP